MFVSFPQILQILWLEKNGNKLPLCEVYQEILL